MTLKRRFRVQRGIMLPRNPGQKNHRWTWVIFDKDAQKPVASFSSRDEARENLVAAYLGILTGTLEQHAA